MVPSPCLQAETLSLDISQPPRLVERIVSAAASPSSLHLISHESISPLRTVQGVGGAEFRGGAAGKEAGPHRQLTALQADKQPVSLSGAPVLPVSLALSFPLISDVFLSLCIQVFLGYPITAQRSDVKRVSEVWVSGGAT